MAEHVLFVDDEPEVLAGYARLLRRRFDVTLAGSGWKALDLVSSHAYSLIVADLRMPDIDGVELLRRVRQLSPDTVRIMLTGAADLDAAARAINEGWVFRFLTKPVSEPVLVAAVTDGLRQHALQTAERDLLERTLRGCVSVLTEILSAANPCAYTRALRVRHAVTHICRRLGIQDTWEVDLAAMLYQIGQVALPTALLAPGTGDKTGSPDIDAIHATVAHDLLAEIPRLSRVAAIVARQGDRDVSAAVEADPVAVAASILSTARDYDRIAAEEPRHDAVLARLRAEGRHAPALVDALTDLEPLHGAHELTSIPVTSLREGMVLQQDFAADDGTRLGTRGEVVTTPLAVRVRMLARMARVSGSLFVLAPTASR